MDARREIIEAPLAHHGGRLASANFETISIPANSDFSVCLNAYGPAPIVREAIRNADVTEYPDRFCRAPRQAASYRWERPMDEIVFGAGAAELIHAVCFAYLSQGDHVLITQPAFGEYQRAASLCGAKFELVTAPISADENAQWDAITELVGAVFRTRPRMVFLASPTSPVGTQYAPEVLQRLASACARTDCLLILDQSYDAFSSNAIGTPALPAHECVVHIRSLTKDHALAGIRAAFSVTTPQIAGNIERARVPWASSTPAQAAAVAAMSNEAMLHVSQTTLKLRQDAARISDFCQSVGLTVEPSSTHYMLIRCANGAAARETLLAEHRILVRDCTSFGLPEYIRVAARLPDSNAVLMDALLHLGRSMQSRNSRENQ